MKRMTALMAALSLSVALHAQTAAGLRTDLVASTDAVYSGGYLTSVPIENVDGYRADLQYAQIATPHPSLSWMMKSDIPSTLQTAFRVLVASSRDILAQDRGDIWDSGRIEGAAPRVNCSEALAPGRAYFWKVKLWDNHGREGEWSQIKAFRTSEVLDGTFPRTPLVKSDNLAEKMYRHSDGTLFLDFGRDAFAQARITLNSQVLDTLAVHFGEAASGDRVNRNPGGSIRYCSYPLVIRPGVHTYRIQFLPDRRNAAVKPDHSDAQAVLMPDCIGEVYPFRYMEIEGFEGHVSKSDIVRESVHYAFDDDASYFHSSDSVLNSVWELCRYSMKATSFLGVYVDGDRERIPYEADAIINQLSHYGADAEYAMARYSVDYLMTHATWPTEWILQASIMAWNDYMYTGDTVLLEKDYDILKARTLCALRESNGLISTRTGKLTPEVALSCGYYGNTMRDIVDWPQSGAAGLGKEEAGEADGYVFQDYNTVVNAFHYRALDIMAMAAEALGRGDEAAEFRTQAESVRKAVNELLFDVKAGCYRDGIGTDHHSLHANMFPLAFGMVPEKYQKPVLAFMRSRGMACSVYGAQFLLDALYEACDGAYALSLMNSESERGWYNMLRAGSTITLEAWDMKYKPNLDWNHAWGAAPANAIPRGLLGVTPLEAGWGRMRIRPQTAGLREADAVIPTIRGAVSCSVTDDGGAFMLDVDIPANTTAEVWLPSPGKKYVLTVNGNPVKGVRKGAWVICEAESGITRFQIR